MKKSKIKKIKYNKKGKNLEKLENIFFNIKGKKFNKQNKVSDLLDSIEVFQFISEIEKNFKIKLQASKINEKNFSSLNSILKLI